MIIGIIFVAVAVISGVICLVLYRSRQKKYEGFVLKNSVYLAELNKINARYTFYGCRNYDQSYTYDNKDFYEDISCDDYLIYRLRDISESVLKQISTAKSNRKKYAEYLKEFSALGDGGKFLAPLGRFKLKKLCGVESRLISEMQTDKPITSYTIRITLSCSYMDGHVYASKGQTFSSEEILTFIKRLQNKRGSYYSDEGVWGALCRVERGMVSNKIRFAVYARDGYRCRMCGVSEKYAKLEIDHIIPIAKGGKSTCDNLQTLCHSCNKKKGDGLLGRRGI